MIARIARTAVAVAALLMPCASYAQDVPGIEICTVEKTMERRTSCLQSNVDFLQKTINKIDAGQSAEARCRQPADRGAEGNASSRLQKFVDDLQKKTAEELKKKADAPAKDAAPAAAK